MKDLIDPYSFANQYYKRIGDELYKQNRRLAGAFTVQSYLFIIAIIILVAIFLAG